MMNTEKITLGDLSLVYAPDIDMYSMTALWKEAGSDPNKKPVLWSRQDATKRHLQAISQRMTNISKGDLKSPLNLTQQTYGRYGGTYANWMIFLAYAQYLHPEFHVLVNEYFTRIYAKDVTLVEELFDGLSEENKKHLAIRIHGKRTRNEFTDTLKEHGVVNDGYRQCTEAIYEGTLQKNALQLRKEYGVPATGNIREHLGSLQLSAVDISESQSIEKIKKHNDTGNNACANRCLKVSTLVGNVIATLQKQLETI